jgi:peptidoglycan/LPS O-acetylase OafA/YrhL
MWFFWGALIGIALVLLIVWLRWKNVAVAWYEWLIGAIGLLLLIFAVQNYSAASAGQEAFAPGVFLLVFGLPALFLILVAAGLVTWRWLRGVKGRQSQKAAA